MAHSLDIDGRLGEGGPAVADFDIYLTACAALGYHYGGPELRQLYGAEYGMDLRALDSDCRSLEGAADAAVDVLLVQDNTSQSVVAAWSGTAGVAAGDFLGRQSGSAHSVVARLRGSADALAGLRDELWRVVDAKVATVLAVADQISGHRGVWISAAHAVIGGGGDRAVASEIVDQQVKPFVDTVVCGEVLPALTRSADAVAAAYDSALEAVSGLPVAFDLPGVFGGPASVGLVGLGVTPTIGSAAASVAPSSWVAPQPVSGVVHDAPTAGAVAGVPQSAPVAAAPAATVPVGAEPAAIDAAAPLGTPAPSTAMPADLGLGSAAGGFGRQLADALGGVLGSAAGLAPDSAGLGDLTDGFDDGVDLPDSGDGPDDDRDTDDTDDTDDSDDSDDSEGDDSDEEDDSATDTPDVEPVGAEQAATATDDDAAQQPPAATPPPSSVEVPAEPVAAEPATAKTPCQIAADELPQVGE